MKLTLARVLAVFGLDFQDVKYAVRSFLIGFLVLFGPGALGWLNAWTQWAPGRPYPDFAPLAAAAVAAVAGAAMGLVTLVLRGIEGKSGKGLLRPDPPQK